MNVIASEASEDDTTVGLHGDQRKDCRVVGHQGAAALPLVIKSGVRRDGLSSEIETFIVGIKSVAVPV